MKIMTPDCFINFYFKKRFKKRFHFLENVRFYGDLFVLLRKKKSTKSGTLKVL